MTRYRIICGVFIAAFLAFCLVNFTKSLTPYVTFAEAKNMKGNVQVRGTLEPAGNSTRYSGGKIGSFYIRDDIGQIHQVLYRGTLADGWDKAESLVVVGRYEGDTFVASKVLIKCPSKYQEKVKQ